MEIIETVSGQSVNRIDQILELTAEAFKDDPVSKYLFPNEKKRLEGIKWILGFVIRYGLKHGELYTTAGQPKGMSIWLPPGSFPLDNLDMVREGILAAPFKLGWSTFIRVFRYINYTEKLHQEIKGSNYWYLAFLAVHPQFQKQGIGKTLIQHKLKMVDLSGKPCYLETTDEKNVSFYEKFGFKTISKGYLPGTQVAIWSLKRDC